MHALRDAWECPPIIEDEGIGPTYPNPVQFTNGEDSDHFEGPLENTRKKENVVWILMAVLAVVTVAAFRLLWLKADG
jgi:hypothetical protein